MNVSALAKQKLEVLLTLQFWRRLLGFLKFVGRRLLEDRCMQTAGSLTYTTLLAIIPLFTIALTLFSAFPMFDDYSTRFRYFIVANLVPDASGKVISVYLRQFSDNAEKLTAFGTIGLAVTALLLVFNIEKTFNQIWAVQRQRKLLSRTLIYWAAITLGPLALGLSLSMTSWIYHHSGGLIGGIRIFDSTVRVGPWFVTFAMLSLMYKMIPNCYVPRRHAVAAGLVVGVALELMKALFGLYIKQFVTLKLVYGAFASFPIFLTWLYMCWVIVLGGAVFSASLSYWHGNAWRWQSFASIRFEQALRLLVELSRAHHRGEIMHIDALRRQVSLGLDTAHSLLERMLEKGWVEQVSDDAWLLAISLERITLVEVFEHVVSPLYAHDGQHLAELIGQMRHSLSESLADYAALEATASAEQPA
ncbi:MULTISPECIES: YihY family inner membrane protein [Silvimonas]|uniref:YihY family inner membrane protein n=1 Tax=Silvimonas TaxID=300264 RepID=UPI0024B33290|nr:MULTISPECIES: YihY family inner membrane protein [Silvimonas]MDR3425844.1 YihY family inner membrane protein [Silvimonas sp.]